MKKVLLFLFLVFITQLLFAQEQNTVPVYFQFATQHSRQQLYKQMLDTAIHQYLSAPLADSTEGEWNEAFWSMELLVYRNDYSKKKLSKAWQNAKDLSEDFQKNLLEVSYSIYPVEFKQQVTDLLKAATSIPVFIRCSEYLLHSNASAATKSTIQSLIQTKFDGVENVGLNILQDRLISGTKPKILPPLKEIFNKKFLSNQTG